MKPALRILKRVAITLPVIWLVVTVVFLLIHIVPGDPIVQLLGDGATAGDVAALRQRPGHPLMRLWALRIGGQRRLEMRDCGVPVVIL